MTGCFSLGDLEESCKKYNTYMRAITQKKKYEEDQANTESDRVEYLLLNLIVLSQANTSRKTNSLRRRITEKH
jgi:hypothetical protein